MHIGGLTALGTILFSRRDGREMVLFSTSSCRRAAGGARGRSQSPRGKLLEGAEHNARPQRRCLPPGRPDLLPSRPAPLRRARLALGPPRPAPMQLQGAGSAVSVRPRWQPPQARPLSSIFSLRPSLPRVSSARPPPSAPPDLCVPAAPRQAADGCRPPLLPLVPRAQADGTRPSPPRRRGPAKAACGLPQPAGKDRVGREGPASAAMSALGEPLTAHLLQGVQQQAALAAGPGLHLAPPRAPSDAAVLRDVSVPSASLYFLSFNPKELGPVH